MSKSTDFYPMYVQLPSHWGDIRCVVFSPIEFKSCPPGTNIIERKLKYKIFFNKEITDLPRLACKYDKELGKSFQSLGREINLYNLREAFVVFNKKIEELEGRIKELDKELGKKDFLIEEYERSLGQT